MARPRKFHTDEERREDRNKRSREWYQRKRDKAKAQKMKAKGPDRHKVIPVPEPEPAPVIQFEGSAAMQEIQRLHAIIDMMSAELKECKRDALRVGEVDRLHADIKELAADNKRLNAMCITLRESKGMVYSKQLGKWVGTEGHREQDDDEVFDMDDADDISVVFGRVSVGGTESQDTRVSRGSHR